MKFRFADYDGPSGDDPFTYGPATVFVEAHPTKADGLLLNPDDTVTPMMKLGYVVGFNFTREGTDSGS